MKIPDWKLESMKISFIMRCFQLGKDPQAAADYFDKRAIEKGWTQQDENKL